MAEFDIPKSCKAAVVVNEGPDFHVEVQMVPVPEIGKFHLSLAFFENQNCGPVDSCWC